MIASQYLAYAQASSLDQDVRCNKIYRTMVKHERADMLKINKELLNEIAEALASL